MLVTRLCRLTAGFLFCLILMISGRAVAVVAATEPQPAPADEAALAEADQLNRQAMQLYIQKKYPEAAAAAERMLDIRKKTLGPNHASSVQAMLIVAQCYKAQQNYAKAEPLFETVFAIREKQLGPTEKGTTDVMRVLAAIYEGREKFDAAEPLRKRLLAVAEQQHGPDSPEIDDQLYSLASLYSKKGDHDAAAEQFLQAYFICRRAFGAQHARTTFHCDNLASEYREAGRYAEAIIYFEEVLKFRETTVGRQHLQTLRTIGNLAYLHGMQGQFKEAEQLYLEALREKEKQFGANDIETASTVSSLALLYHQQAMYATAEPLYQRALRIYETVLGPDHVDTAVVVNNLGGFYDDRGDYAAAKPYYERALKIVEATYGDDNHWTISARNNIGMLHHAQGNFEAAEPLLQQALAATERLRGPNHPETAFQLNNLAALHISRREYAAAEPQFRRVAQINRSLLGDDHPKTALALSNLANNNLAQQRPDAAEPLLREALETRKRVLGVNHPDTGSSFQLLAALLTTQGDPAGAEPLAAEAVRIQEDTVGPQHPRAAQAYHQLARIKFGNGDFAAGVQTIDLARRGIQGHVTRVLPALSSREQQLFLTTEYQNDFHFALSLQMSDEADSPTTTRIAEWLLNGKAVAQEALAARNLLSRDLHDSQNADTVAQLLRIRHQLAALAMTSTADSQSASERKSRFAELTAKEEQLAGRLSTSTSSASGRWVDLKHVREAIPADSVLIDIARYEYFDRSESPVNGNWKPARYGAWISSRDQQTATVFVDMGEAEQIDQLVQTVREQVEAAKRQADSAEGLDNEGMTAAIRQDLTSLSQRIWKPLQPHVGAAKQLILSPDGVLWLAPWSALLTGQDGGEYLLEQYRLRFIVSGRDLVREKSSVSARPPVILAHPLFDQQADQKALAIKGIFQELPEPDVETTRSFSAKSSLPTVKPLPNTDIEAIAVKPLMERYTGRETTVYRQQYALERVAKELHGPRLALFATHGFFLPRQDVPVDTSRYVANDSTRAVAVDSKGQAIENPLLRCGLLFAGCNNRSAVVGDDDGILTGLEIVGIDFRGTELVVLSACQTGLGDVRVGEGVAGLRQAFQLAGAESVLATLWEVPDRESFLLITAFFQHLVSGQTRADAIRSAQLERIQKRRERFGAAHPYYWAAFTLTGQ